MSPPSHIADLSPLFSAAGLKHVVISPGSRNAPLIQLFTRSSEFTCHSVVDERSAGYQALGMARQLGQPVALLCTSGTAVLNLAPAVAEAYYQGIPLVVLTADRPLERFPSFNNQWMDQEAPFYAWSRGFLQWEDPGPHPGNQRKMQEEVMRLMQAATRPSPGPVHLNLLLEEPLYEILAPSKKLSAQGLRALEVADVIEKEEIPAFPRESRILLLAGMSPPDARVNALLSTLAQRGVAVIAEPLSNMKDPRFIAHPELMLGLTGGAEQEGLAPELLLSLGGQVLSKRLKLLLQALPGLRHMEASLSWLEAWMAEEQPASPSGLDYARRWKALEKAALKEAGQRQQGLAFCNFQVVGKALEEIPHGSILHLGNSATVRYAQLYPLREDLDYYANRGTSGIDGCLSAALGAARVSDRLHVLLVGDLSFVYDSNALWQEHFPENLKILVLNDGGGGIFRLLDGPGRMPFFEEFSVTRHPVSLEKLSTAFGRECLRVEDEEALAWALGRLWDSKEGLVVVEADTRKSENSRIFKQFFETKR